MFQGVSFLVQALVSLSAIVIIFFALVWMQNGNTLIVSIEKTKGTRIVPQNCILQRMVRVINIIIDVLMYLSTYALENRIKGKKF